MINHLKIDSALKHFFRSREFYVEYDRDVSSIPLGILNIPALSSVLHFAWAVGCDVKMGELDETYLKGLEKAKNIFSNNPAYKFLSFNSSLDASKTTENAFEKQNRQALLFSGGLDSTASYIRRRPEQLIMIWGLDIPTEWEEFWNRVIKTHGKLPLTFIKTNTLELYDLNLLASLGEKCLAGYYAGFSYSFITFGVCPPATVDNVDNVMMASTSPIRQYGDPDYPFQNYKPQYFVDKHLGWANIETFDVENDYNRPEKIEKIIKPYFDENGPSQLRVCGRVALLKVRKDKSKLNCSLCDKCTRAIATLSNYGIDPQKCGFNLNEKTFAQIKNNIKNRRFIYDREKYFWGEIKKHIPEDITHDFYGSRSFLEWLKEYKL